MPPKSETPSKKTKRIRTPTPLTDSNGMFTGMVVFLVDSRVQSRRLQIWKQKLEQMGAKIEEYLSKRVTHIFAMNWDALIQKVDSERLTGFKGNILVYQWLEDSLRVGQKVSEDFYLLREDSVGGEPSVQSSKEVHGHGNRNNSGIEESPHAKKLRSSSPEAPRDSTRYSPEGSRGSSVGSQGTATIDELHEASITSRDYDGLSKTLNSPGASSNFADSPDKSVSALPSYNPPDLNKNITDIFKKLIDIYRALGDDRRSFSYYKAIPVIEKLPFRIESSDQVKHLPSIGKSLRDHIQEIVTTGKLSKLEHFENDEKCTIVGEDNLFVWGSLGYWSCHCSQTV